MKTEIIHGFLFYAQNGEETVLNLRKIVYAKATGSKVIFSFSNIEKVICLATAEEAESVLNSIKHAIRTGELI